jgi:sugar phosphate isomerase/epimerase
VGKIGYIHLKTSKNNVPQPVLDGNQLAFDTILDLLQKNGKTYVAIELDPVSSATDEYANVVKSVEYLKKNF